MNCTCTESSGFIEDENSGDHFLEYYRGQRSLCWNDPALIMLPHTYTQKEVKEQKLVSHIS